MLDRVFRWLKRILKYTLVFLLTVVIALTSWLSYYYVTVIRPYKPIIEDILVNADPENRNPPANIVAMIDAHFWCKRGKGSVSIIHPDYCNSRLKKSARLTRMMPKLVEKRGLDRHLLDAMMTLTLMESLSEQDKNALYSELSYASYDKRGLNHFSQEYFGKPLSKLSVEESATVIAMLRAPSLYRRKPERLKESAQYLLDVYNKMPK